MLIDLPIDVQMAKIDFDIETYEPLAVYKRPEATVAQAQRILDMLASGGASADRRRWRHRQRRRGR